MIKTIKKLLARFRTWQRNPFGYENNSPGTTCCQNCGTEFADNYCPRCGQPARTKRLSWQSVREGVMNMWGAGNRSMPYSLLQLLGRPGHFIHDYLSGKRQVSYPPFRMLFIVAVIALFFNKMLDSPEAAEAVESGDNTAARFEFMDSCFLWFADNPGWAMIVFCGLFILPTWVVFRFAPRYPKHTLPEGFFIQVFMGTLVLLTSILGDLLAADAVLWLIVVYYFVAYLQLFGYRVWGTLWRLVVTFISGLGILVFLIFSIEIIIKKGSTSPEHSLKSELGAMAFLLFLNFLLLYIAYKIGKRGWLRKSISGQQEEPMESEAEALAREKLSKNIE